MMTLAAIIDPLRAANRLSSSPLFEWQLVSFDGEPIKLTCGIRINVNDSLENAAQHTHAKHIFTVVAAFNHHQHTPTAQLPILRKMAKRSESLFALESGVWLLARAGIIESHTVTVHWEDLENLAFSYPSLNVVAERYVIDRRVWTSGGASPSLDMFLHYLRSIGRVSLALDVANVFIYNDDKPASQAQTAIGLGRVALLEPRLAKALNIMEQHIEEPQRIDQIAFTVGISVRQLEHLSRQYLNLSPGTYYQRLRLQTARRLALDSNDSILEIAVKSGFSSQSALSRAFKKRYGKSPSQLKNHLKYQSNTR